MFNSLTINPLFLHKYFTTSRPDAYSGEPHLPSPCSSHVFQVMNNDAFAAMSSYRRSKYEPNSAAYTSFSSPMSFLRSSLSVPYYSEDSQSASSSSINGIMYQSRLILEHRDLINRHSLCLNRLREATREAEALRQENAGLCSLNRELNENLSLVVQAAVKNRISSDDFVNRFHGLCIGDKEAEGRAWEEVSCDLDEIPTSVMVSPKTAEVVGIQRAYLPKSISVRSNGYLNTSHPRATHAQTTASLSAMKKQQQKVTELDVYSQGMWKTIPIQD